MIATLGTILVWAIIVVGGIAGLFLALIGLMVVLSYR